MTLKVIVIDDSELVLSVVRSFLSSAGHTVLTRAMAVGTRAAVLRERPDVVLLDVHMPLLDGVEICASIRAHPSMASTRVFLHSDRPEAELAALVDRCGADGYLCKTSDRDRFLRRFDALCDRGPATGADEPGRYLLVACGARTEARLRDELVCRLRVDYVDSGADVLRRVYSGSPPDVLLLGTSIDDLHWDIVFAQATRRDARYGDRTVLLRESSASALPSSALHWDASESVEALEATLEKITAAL